MIGGEITIAQQKRRIADLEAQVEQHRVAEEMQIALREKADEREAALAAHVERLRAALNYSSEYLYGSHLNTIGHGSKAHMEMVSALEATPATSLAQRDEESMRKGFWWGFERARMRPDENNIPAEWEDVKALIAKNEQHRKSNEG